MDFVALLNDSDIVTHRDDKQVVAKIKLVFSDVAIRHTMKNDEYKMCVFASGDIQCHAALNPPDALTLLHTNVCVFPDTVLCLRLEPHPPRFIHFWLYRTSDDSDTNLRVQLLVGCGRVSTGSLLASSSSSHVDLLDTDEEKQCAFNVSIDQSYNQESVAQLTSSHHACIIPNKRDISADIIRRSDQAYSTLTHDDMQYFVYVETPTGRLPLVSFPLLVTCLKVDESKAETMLLLLMKVACVQLNIEEEVYMLNNVKAANVIGEMATLITRALLYVPDASRGGEGDRETITDQWARLGCFPDLGLVGFDCEDGAEQVLEILHVLKYAKLKDLSLRKLQNVMKRYTPFLAVGQLRISKDEIVAHAFVIVLDTHYVDYLVAIRDGSSQTAVAVNLWPPMLIESTNYTQSVWSRDSSDDEFREHIDRYLTEQMFFDCFEDGNRKKWEFLIRVRTPVTIINRQNAYPPLSALLTADYQNGNKLIHFLCTKNGSQNRVGLDIADLMSYNMQVKVKEAINITPEEIRILKDTLSELPPSRFPEPPQQDAENESKSERYMYCFNMRKIDYDKYEKEITYATDRFVKQMKLKQPPRISHVRLTTSNVQLTSIFFF